MAKYSYTKYPLNSTVENIIDINNLDSFLSSQSENTVDSAIDIRVTGLTQNTINGAKDAEKGTLQYILQQHPKIYVNICMSLDDLENVTDLSYAFYNCTNLVAFKDIHLFFPFENKKNTIHDYSNWISTEDYLNFKNLGIFYKIKDVSYMFYGCTNLKTFYNTHQFFSYINTRSRLYLCFYSISPFYATTNSIHADSMFQGCTSLIFDNTNKYTLNFNVPDNANISLSYMFQRDINLEKLTINILNTNKLINSIDCSHMLEDCSKINSNNFYIEFSTGMQTSMNLSCMYQNCKCLTIDDFFYKNFIICKSLDISYMYRNCKNLTKVYFGYIFCRDKYKSTKDFTSNRCINKTGLFFNCTSLEEIHGWCFQADEETFSNFNTNTFSGVPNTCKVYFTDIPMNVVCYESPFLVKLTNQFLDYQSVEDSRKMSKFMSTINNDNNELNIRFFNFNSQTDPKETLIFTDNEYSNDAFCEQIIR